MIIHARPIIFFSVSLSHYKSKHNHKKHDMIQILDGSVLLNQYAFELTTPVCIVLLFAMVTNKATTLQTDEAAPI